MAEVDPQRDIIEKFSRNRPLAHRVLFSHRHPDRTPEFHEELIELWHSPLQYVLALAFRGSAKSTIAEEGILIGAGLREFKNFLLLGSNFDRAAERLFAIRHEIETNEMLAQVFGDLRGPVWGEDKIITSTGIMIQALGRNQALRGVKYLDMRPDGFFADDIEDKESVRTPEARYKTKQWFMTEVLPACDPSAKGRMAATPLDPESLPMELSKPGTGWTVRTFPIEYVDVKGQRAATWPGRFSLAMIDKIQANFAASGMMREYRMEYLCQAEAPEDKPFKGEMFRIEIKNHVWEAVYAMFDPARTVQKTSATTGFAAWSWINNRLIVWDAWARLLMPDEIVSAIFRVNEELRPITIGVEEDGLNEFLMQPIRQEQIKRMTTVPVRPLRAPKGKLDFIRGLQPFFNAREVIFAKDLPDLRAQLLSFPTGRIDAPNALAYALRMRAGIPLYDNFQTKHIEDDMRPLPTRPAWLALNATRGLLTGVLVQLIDGNVRVYADWVREGEPQLLLKDIVSEANLEAGRAVRLLGGPLHYDQYNNVGLIQAVRRLPASIERGTPPDMGRAEIVKLLQAEHRGRPKMMFSTVAQWTLNAMAGGYCRALNKQGLLNDYAEEGPYRVLMEGLESFVGLLRAGSPEREDDDIRYAVTHDGRKYISALPGNRQS